MARLFVVGSTNIDETVFIDQLPVVGETRYANAFHRSVGGKGANQALAANAFGVPTYFISKIGKDQQLIIENLLTKHQMSKEGLIIDDQESTGQAFIININGDNRIMLNAGANKTITFAEIKRKLNAQAGDILLMQLELPYALTKQVIEYGKSLGMLVVLNPAPANKEVIHWLTYVDYLIINQSEADLLTSIYPQSMTDGEKVYAILKKHGLKNCVITLGEKGSLFLNENTAAHIPTIKIEPVDTTGAGDTFIGGFIYGFIKDYPIERQLRFANVAGSLSCLTIGAQDAAPSIKKIIEKL